MVESCIVVVDDQVSNPKENEYVEILLPIAQLH